VLVAEAANRGRVTDGVQAGAEPKQPIWTRPARDAHDAAKLQAGATGHAAGEAEQQKYDMDCTSSGFVSVPPSKEIYPIPELEGRCRQ
jgi:hypothetical protein